MYLPENNKTYITNRQTMAVAERKEAEPKKSDRLFDKPQSNNWLTAAASTLTSQSPFLAESRKVIVTYNEIS